MVELDAFSHWVGHLPQRIQLTAKVGEMVLTFYFVHRVVQLPKVCHVLLNLPSIYRVGQHDRKTKI